MKHRYWRFPTPGQHLMTRALYSHLVWLLLGSEVSGIRSSSTNTLPKGLKCNHKIRKMPEIDVYSTQLHTVYIEPDFLRSNSKLLRYTQLLLYICHHKISVHRWGRRMQSPPPPSPRCKWQTELVKTWKFHPQGGWKLLSCSLKTWWQSQLMQRLSKSKKEKINYPISK